MGGGFPWLTGSQLTHIFHSPFPLPLGRLILTLGFNLNHSPGTAWNIKSWDHSPPPSFLHQPSTNQNPNQPSFYPTICEMRIDSQCMIVNQKCTVCHYVIRVVQLLYICLVQIAATAACSSWPAIRSDISSFTRRHSCMCITHTSLEIPPGYFVKFFLASRQW